MSSALQPIASGMLDAFAPLDRALRDPEAFRVLLRNLGWERAFGDEVLAQDPLGDIAAAAAELMQSGAEIVRVLGNETDRDPLVDELFDVIEALQTLIAGLQDLDTSSLPASLDDPALWTGLALDLPEYLLVRYLERYKPVLYGLLRLAGVIEDDEEALEAGDPERLPYVRRVVVWDNLVGLIGDPPGHLQSLYHWDDGRPFDHARLLDELARLVSLTGVRAERLALRPTIVDGFFDGTPPPDDARELAVPLLRARVDGSLAEQGVLLAPVPPRPAGAVDGLYVANLAWGDASGGVELTSTWDLVVTGSLDATGAVGAHLRPGELAWETVPGEGGVELAVEGTPDEPWLLLGAEDGIRLEVSGLRLALAFEGGSEADVAVKVSTLPQGDRGGIAFTIEPGDGDAFMGRLLPAPIEADLDLDLTWSARDGFSLGAGVGLELTVPIDKTLGPVTLEAIHLALAGDTECASLLLGITGSVLLPPFEARVENVGLALYLEPGAEDGLFGGLALSAGFKPPDAVGFELDLEGASGGGYIWIDQESGRYAGGLALDFVTIGLAAVVVVDTKLPGDPDGWALFASLSLTFPQVPLGFGFFLAGVGGIVCLNRTMDVEALASGLKSGAVDAILFPEDPQRDAALIVSQLDSWFPVAEGSLVFGVAGRITWGTPKTLVTADVGVVLSFPELDFAVLGSVTIELPEEEPLLELHMDTLGTIDLSEQTVLVVASLHDSTLLHTISLSGDMAMYARFGADPYFLLSVGGYHPDFEPPCGLPAVVGDLERMRVEVEISEDVWYALETYFAVTSNSLQFGANASFEAGDRFLGVTYKASGSVGFDVLLVFSPFSFSAGFYASVSVTAGSGDKELMAVSLSAHLEGPKPWYATGQASFDFFGIGVSLEIEVGGAVGAEAPELENVQEAVMFALGDPSAWRGVTPAGTGAAVLVAEEEGVALPIRPDAEIEAIQTVAPLERTLDHYGIYEILGKDRLDVTGASIGGEDANWETVVDWFPPAQYDDMSRSEKLGAPSYEQMVAGVRLGTETVSVSAVPEHARTVTPDFESRILDADGTRELDDQPLATDLTTAAAGLRLDAPRRGTSGRAVSSASFAVGPTKWTTADAVTGRSLRLGMTYRDALVERREAMAADPSTRAAVRVAPTHALAR